MGKFNTSAAGPTAASPIVTEPTPSGRTHEGAPGYAYQPKGELFLLAVSNMVGEKTFYETPGHRDERYERLIRDVAVLDPHWTAGFLGWLRGEGNMRSASLVGAAEAVKARLDAPSADQHRDGQMLAHATNRRMIASVLQRADEPGELLAYWTSRYGRAIPKPVKRGVGDAIARLYTEYGLLKYDTASKGFRFADVIDLVHPSAVAPWQGALFRYALDRRHNRDSIMFSGAELPMVYAQTVLRSAAAEVPSVLLDTDQLKAAGFTWEDALSLAGSKVDKRLLWEALIPTMGYMAALRNLRNFDEAGVHDLVASAVALRLADPAQVARSRQLPMRFLSAYRAAPSLRWSYPLEQALGHSLANIPALPGRTLVMVDTSSSMNETFSKDGTLKRWDAAVIFGVALAQRCETADVVSFSSTAQYWGDADGANTKVFPLKAGESLLRSIDRWKDGGWFLGGGTATAAAIRQHYAGHTRVVVVTDEQTGSDLGEVSTAAPVATPMYTWNLAGYERGHAPSGSGNRHTFGGLTDAAFRLIPLLELVRAGRGATWPWEVAPSVS